MLVEQSSVNPGWFTVHVSPGELVTPSGKTLPFGFTIGVVQPNGKIILWRPAVSGIPRDYKRAAMAVLEKARSQLRADGKVK